ncbi:hypothetical protein PIROE2DRAFT_4553 [Piromyces sp. E2]|nr:hypothetical protein PIROE2DRAFT_4553 [Piromyces sp. E2]|eukprot:OUM67875.1 hypothetical protein PIROE2DRAFT_4553 [Piromyces sp. E2]
MIPFIIKLIFLLFILNLLSLISALTPYSECSVGRITAYKEYENGGSCGFGIPKIYGAAPNETFYNLGEKCGICYELIGPNGILFFMVDSHCPVKGNESACSGDMLHFDLHKNGFETIMDDGVVLYHDVALKKVYYSFDNSTWIGLNREGDYNHWTVRGVELPMYIQLESISGERIQTIINEITASHEYDTGGQFTPPEKYYDPFTLKEVNHPKTEGCCKLYDAFTDIYYEGKFLGEWQDISSCERDISYTKDCYEGISKFFNRIKPESVRYNAIKFALKTKATCENCLKLQLDDYSPIRMSTREPGKWEEKMITMVDLGLNTTKFRKFMFQGSKKDSQIMYFDHFKLVKSEYDDQGLCHINTIQDHEHNQEKESDATTTPIIQKSITIVVVLLTIYILFY